MLKILVIDDDQQICEFLHHLLTNEGFFVANATNGRIGLDLQKELHAQLVISDIIMPEKEGIEIILELKKSTPEVKVIAISGGGMIGSDTLLQLAMRAGADRALPKPVTKRKLLDSIYEVLSLN